MNRSAPIAISGVGARLPGSGWDVALFFKHLLAGQSFIGRAPAGRDGGRLMRDPAPEIHAGAFLETLKVFDAARFGMTLREAAALDPQQRLVLEVACEALEDAGIAPGDCRGARVGVFLGVMRFDHAWTSVPGAELDSVAMSTAGHSFVAARLSAALSLRGPSLAVDTSSSSSLTALLLARDSLLADRCDIAIAGGVNLITSHALTRWYAASGAFSPTGRCRPFDAAADGTVHGEACVLYALRRTTTQAGPTPRGLLLGGATNHNASSGLIFAPSVTSQVELVRAAMTDAAVQPDEVCLLEAHGTGTPAGDAAEWQALSMCLGERGPPVAVTASKANVGHSQAAAGAVGLLGALEALAAGTAPPLAGFMSPAPATSSGSRLRVGQAPSRLVSSAARRVAGIGALGVNGANAYVFVAAPPAAPAPQGSSAGPVVIRLSGTSTSAIESTAHRWAQASRTHEAPLVAIAQTSEVGRDALVERAAWVGTSAAAWVEDLEAFSQGKRPASIVAGHAHPHDEVAFVFSGQGGQWGGMARELWEADPEFQRTARACLAALERQGAGGLEPFFTGAALPDDVGVLQPVLWTLQVALATALKSRGVTPTVTVGHSLGEVAAATFSGALSLDDGARVVVARSAALRGLIGHGAMLHLNQSPAAVQELMADAREVCVSVHNSRRSTVISGPVEALERLSTRAAALGWEARQVKTGGAGHSPAVDAILPPVRAALAKLTPTQGWCPLLSTSDLEEHRGERLDAAFWCANLRQPVQFATAIGRLLTRGVKAFVEIGPHPVVAQAIETEGDAAPVLCVVPAMERERGGPAAIERAVARLFVSGVRVKSTGPASSGWRLPPTAHTPTELPDVFSAPALSEQRTPTWVQTGTGWRCELTSLWGTGFTPADARARLEAALVALVADALLRVGGAGASAEGLGWSDSPAPHLEAHLGASCEVNVSAGTISLQGGGLLPGYGELGLRGEARLATTAPPTTEPAVQLEWPPQRSAFDQRLLETWDVALRKTAAGGAAGARGLGDVRWLDVSGTHVRLWSGPAPEVLTAPRGVRVGIADWVAAPREPALHTPRTVAFHGDGASTWDSWLSNHGVVRAQTNSSANAWLGVLARPTAAELEQALDAFARWATEASTPRGVLVLDASQVPGWPWLATQFAASHGDFSLTLLDAQGLPGDVRADVLGELKARSEPAVSVRQGVRHVWRLRAAALHTAAATVGDAGRPLPPDLLWSNPAAWPRTLTHGASVDEGAVQLATEQTRWHTRLRYPAAIVATPLELSSRLQHNPALAAWPLLERLSAYPLSVWASSDTEAARGVTAEDIVRVLAAELGIAVLPLTATLAELGLDSARALQLRARLEDLLRTRVNATIFFNHRTVGDVVAALLPDSERVSAVEPAAESEWVVKRADEVSQLSNEDAERVLEDTLQSLEKAWK